MKTRVANHATRPYLTVLWSVVFGQAGLPQALVDRFELVQELLVSFLVMRAEARQMSYLKIQPDSIISLNQVNLRTLAYTLP